ncbi:MAG: hypothetical protein J6T20_02270 [Treponema sp.]|jgi:hypothetical protein|nr:hypothetical protein [Treponema sp.]
MDIQKRELPAAKNKMKDIDFTRTVKLKDGAKDFLEDSSWKEDLELPDKIEEDYK